MKTSQLPRLRTATCRFPIKMMKTVAILLISVCLLCLFSCGKEENREEQGTTGRSEEYLSQTPTVTEQVTQAPTSTKGSDQGFAGEEDIFG